MSKFDFFDEGVRRVFDNYELPLEENAWANFQSGLGTGASTSLLKSFILPGLMVAGLFTALHLSTPISEDNTVSHTTENNNVTTHSSDRSDLNSSAIYDTDLDQNIPSVSNGSNTLISSQGANADEILKGIESSQENDQSKTEVADRSEDEKINTGSSDKGSNNLSTGSPKETVQEKLPENMAADTENGPSKTKFLGSRYKLGAPEKFTPNNDNSNDTFMPPKLNKNSKFILRIYDKGGNLVFVSRSVEDTWDGTVLNTNTPAELGDYRWNVILETENKRREYGGNVKLVR